MKGAGRAGEAKNGKKRDQKAAKISVAMSSQTRESRRSGVRARSLFM
jgi:hypothetical protein